MADPDLLSPEAFAEAMREAVADPSNSATPGGAPDVIAYDPRVLAAEGGGDDPDACADHLGDGEPEPPPPTGMRGLISTAWRATWLADEFRRAGLVVVEVEGWKTRGYDFPDPPIEEGVSIFHHTASNRNSGPAGGLRIVTYGREGLAGPIANWLTARNGVIYVVAAGIANNAGTGNARAAGMPNVTGNSNTLANEMENDGIGEPYPAVQRTAALISHAVVHRKMGWPAGRGIGHLEWSLTGKIDPFVGSWGQMSAARTQLAAVIAGATPKEEEDLPMDIVWAPDITRLTDNYLKNAVDPNTGKVIPTPYERAFQLVARMAHNAMRDAYATKLAAAASEAREKATMALLEKVVSDGGGSLDLAAVKAIVEAEGEKSRVAQAARDKRIADALDPA